MPSIRSKRFYDLVWERISRLTVPGAGSALNSTVESPFSAGPLVIDEPLIIYVEQTGQDAPGRGGQNSPFRTVQAAIDSIRDAQIHALVDILVGPGSFPAFSIGNLNIRSDINPSTKTQSEIALRVTGTLGAPTLTSGTTTGTVTSSSIVNGHTQTVDLAQNWTIDELKGFIFTYIDASANVIDFVIVGNTSNTLLLAANLPPPVGFAYQILEQKTRIDSGVAAIGSIAGSQQGRISVSNTAGSINGAISISNFLCVVDGMVSGAAAVTVRNAAVEFLGIRVQRFAGSTSFLSFSWQNARITANRCYATSNSTTSASGASVNGSNLTVSGSYFRNLQTGITYFNNGYSETTLSNNVFEGITTGVNKSIGLLNLTSTNRFIGCTTAFASGTSTFSSGIALVSSSTASVFRFENCVSCITVIGPGFVTASACTGTGNTNGITLTKGARCQISNTATLGATTELSVDGVTGTLATLRSNSPRVFPLVPNPYGTYVYE
jgi:hypothetical protein